MSDPPSPADAADAIAAARDRMVAFARERSAEEWAACPLEDAGDPRSVGVLVDHVGHAYEYLTAFIRATVDGDAPAIDGRMIDELNAEHAEARAAVDVEAATARLLVSGDGIVELVRSLTPAEMELVDGRVRRLAAIAVRHADGHRTDLEQALTPRPA